jgi:hypothetical protein
VNPILAAKLGGALALIAVLFGAGYHFGGMASKTALERDHADMAAATVNALLAQRAQATADHNRLQEVIDRYDATPPDPIIPGLAHRVYVYATAHCGGVPQSGSVAPGTEAPTPVPIGHSSVESALGDVLSACSADAAQMTAMIQLAP